MLTLLIIILVLQVFQIGIIIYLSNSNIELEDKIRGEDLYWSQNNAPK